MRRARTKANVCVEVSSPGITSVSETPKRSKIFYSSMFYILNTLSQYFHKH
jgi:hypothetical protein